MNIEKVKEIKKGLKFMMGFVISNKLPYIDGNTPKQIAYEEIFNYINELERENKMLKKNRLVIAKPLKKSHREILEDLSNQFIVPVDSAIEDIKIIPIETVRCKDCKHRYTDKCALWYTSTEDDKHFCGSCKDDDFYCQRGEK